MKRLLLVLLLAAVLLGLLATSTLAAPVPTVRGSLRTAYVIAYADGSWLEITDAAAPAGVAHWAYDEEGNYILDPIPANYDVVMDMGWNGMPLGQVESASQKFLITISIPEAGVAMSGEEGLAYWTGATLWDEWWAELLFPISAFNPRSRLQAYCNHWWCPLTGDEGIATNLTADKKLPQGTYTVHYAETVLQPITGLDFIVEWWKRPYRATPGTNVSDPYTFVVGPPVP